MRQRLHPPSARTGPGAARAALSLALLAVLLFQALPVALPAAFEIAGGEGEERSFLEPIQVCSGDGGPQGPLCDMPWLTAAAPRPSCVAGRGIPVCPSDVHPGNVLVSTVFRPPRLLRSGMA